MRWANRGQINKFFFLIEKNYHFKAMISPFSACVRQRERAKNDPTRFLLGNRVGSFFILRAAGEPPLYFLSA